MFEDIPQGHRRDRRQRAAAKIAAPGGGVRSRLLALAMGSVLLGLCDPAEAHPHVFVDAKAELVFDKSGQITAVRNIWQFDKGYTTFATQGLDANRNGKLDDAELVPLAKTNVESLAEYDFFTFLTVQGKKAALSPPKEYWLQFVDGRLTLFFTLPLSVPASAKGQSSLTVFDREYFVAFTFVKDSPIRLDGAPSSCKAQFQPPHALDAALMSKLAALPADQRNLPPALESAALSLSSSFQVSCP